MLALTLLTRVENVFSRAILMLQIQLAAILVTAVDSRLEDVEALNAMGRLPLAFNHAKLGVSSSQHEKLIDLCAEIRCILKLSSSEMGVEAACELLVANNNELDLLYGRTRQIHPWSGFPCDHYLQCEK
jgi:hypothetical protein